jgi:hypothetical protein
MAAIPGFESVRQQLCAASDSGLRSHSDDMILYTITSDSTLRIFFPVFDSPRILQLHASLDLFSSFLYTQGSQPSLQSSVFWLDRDILDGVLANNLKQPLEQEDSRTRRIQDIKDEGWDLFLRVIGDGSIVVSAVTVSLGLH